MSKKATTKIKNYDLSIKLMLLGESGVGKSCMLLRFIDDKFSTNFVTTLGVEYKQKIFPIGEKNVLVQIWDTAGQERFHSITPTYYKNVDGVILVYDITDEGSFDSKSRKFFENEKTDNFIGVHYWMKNINENADQNVLIYLVGNKIDMAEKRVIKMEKGKEIAEEYKLSFIETSAKANININETLNNVTKLILDKKGGDLVERRSELDERKKIGDAEGPRDDDKRKGGCCGGGKK